MLASTCECSTKKINNCSRNLKSLFQFEAKAFSLWQSRSIARAKCVFFILFVKHSDYLGLFFVFFSIFSFDIFFLVSSGFVEQFSQLNQVELLDRKRE